MLHEAIRPSPEAATLPATAILIPALNEAASIGAVIASLLRSGNEFVAELIVADGGSTDGTQEIVRAAAATDPRVRLLHNPARLQAAGVNLAARAACPKAEVLLRADAHATYPPGFARATVEALAASGADSAVVRLRSVGDGCFQRAVSAASNSRAGSGGSVHRSGGASGFVDHGHHAAFRRWVFDTLGGYDETFAVNEDAELDARLRQAGGRIWFAADVEILYLPRRTPAALVRQYWRYGRGRARTFLKHQERLTLRRILPQSTLLAVVAGLLLSPAIPVLALLPATYFGLVSLVGVGLTLRHRDRCVLASPLALAIMHLCWASGFLAEIAVAAARSLRS